MFSVFQPFPLASLPQILNEGIEQDLNLGGIPQWILQSLSICMDTNHESPKIYCLF